jgi:hypothetical protein
MAALGSTFHPDRLSEEIMARFFSSRRVMLMGWLALLQLWTQSRSPAEGRAHTTPSDLYVAATDASSIGRLYVNGIRLEPPYRFLIDTVGTRLVVEPSARPESKGHSPLRADIASLPCLSGCSPREKMSVTEEDEAEHRLIQEACNLLGRLYTRRASDAEIRDSTHAFAIANARYVATFSPDHGGILHMNGSLFPDYLRLERTRFTGTPDAAPPRRRYTDADGFAAKARDIASSLRRGTTILVGRRGRIVGVPRQLLPQFDAMIEASRRGRALRKVAFPDTSLIHEIAHSPTREMKK